MHICRSTLCALPIYNRIDGSPVLWAWAAFAEDPQFCLKLSCCTERDLSSRSAERLFIPVHLPFYATLVFLGRGLQGLVLPVAPRPSIARPVMYCARNLPDPMRQSCVPSNTNRRIAWPSVLDVYNQDPILLVNQIRCQGRHLWKRRSDPA
jgi:hypothetical protein